MVRAITNKDINQILSLGNSNFNLSRFSREKLLNDYTALLFQDLLTIKAYLIGEIIDSDFHLYEIFVGKKFRANKIGSFLIDFVINFCKQKKIAHIYLEVGIDNFRAQRLYLSKKFVSYSIRNNYYLNGEDAINYMRIING